MIKNSYHKSIATARSPTREIERRPPSARIKESKVFFDIHGVENDGSVESPPGVVFVFKRAFAESIDFKHEMEKGDLTYAPSLRNPYYMSIAADKLQKITWNSLGMPQWATEARHVKGQVTETVARDLPTTAIKSFFYISLKLLHDLANDEVDWLSLSELKDPQVTPNADTKPEEEAKILKQIAFASLGDPPQKDPIDLQPYVPSVPKLNPETKSEPDTKMEIENSATSSSSMIDWDATRKDIKNDIRLKKARRVYIPIRHQRGWLIWIRLPDWNHDRQKRRAQLMNLKRVFEDLWKDNTATDPEIAAGYRPRYSSTDFGFPLYVLPEPKKLRLRLGWEANQVNTRFAALVEKINNGNAQLAMELIIVTEERVHRERLIKMGENPFNLFNTYIAAKDFDKYMKDLEVLPCTDQSLTRHDAHRSRYTTNGYLESKLTEYYKPMTSGYTRPQTKARELVQKGKKGKKGKKEKKEGGNLYWADGDCGSTWCIGVSWDKIKNAGGKREKAYSPKAIMGKSANEIAEDAFGWKMLDQAQQYLGHKHRLSSGMFMAEWLHLCAFSWGGLTTSPKGADFVYQSSDIPENLIIGTSETNSVMTRFEKAWQSLVRDASCLTIRGEDNSSFSAELIVTRNRNENPVIRDEKGNDTYSRGSSFITQEEISISKEFHFVAYTVYYSLEFPKGCRLLNMQAGSSLKTTFYPFLRPLYHRLEDQLDQMLYEKIKDRYSSDAIFISAGISAISIGQPTVNGWAPYGSVMRFGTDPYTIEKKKATSKKGKGSERHPHDTKGAIQDGAGIHPDLGYKDYEKIDKKLKTF